MRHARAIARAAALCATTAALYLAWLAVLPFVSVSERAARRWRALVFGAWARAAAAVCGMRIRLKGVPPRGPFLLVANHLSYMDVVALGARLDCVFVAKSEVARWPLVGPLARSMGTVFVNRRRRRTLPATLAEIEHRLARGAGVVIFAEGTSTAGARVAPFKPSLLELAARARTPVHYASLSYRTPPDAPDAGRAVCWWGEMTFLRHLYELFQLERFEAELVFGDAPIRADDRKALAHKLWTAVSAQFVPVG